MFLSMEEACRAWKVRVTKLYYFRRSACTNVEWKVFRTQVGRAAWRLIIDGD